MANVGRLIRVSVLSAAMGAALVAGFADTKGAREVVVQAILGDSIAPSQARSHRYLREVVIPQRGVDLSADRQIEIMNLWHELWIWDDLSYLGVHIQKNPPDLFMMQQIIHEIRPDYIVETGTLHGGSAVYWAHVLDGLGLTESRIITVDIEDQTQEAAKQPLWQEYVEFIHADSVAPSTIAEVKRRLAGGGTVLVVLDSLHTAEHVQREMELYGELVTPGSYMVVEDTNIDGVPVLPGYGPGQMAGVIDYLDTGGDAKFEQDFSREKLLFTYNPGGWLRRKR
ncbi:MAG: CmcI family methyltransferase [Myxococcota bacterium]